MANILILAALPEEADMLFASATVRDQRGPFPLRHFDHGHHAVTIAVCGMGKVNAAFAAGFLGVAADLLLMTGSCGSIGAAPGAYWLAEAVQHDYGAMQGGAFSHYRAGDWPIGEARAVEFRAMADPGLGLAHARIASGDSFVACPDAAAALSQRLGATLVDMEVGAVAQTAERLGRPWAAVKAVSDEANGCSEREFQANLRRAAKQAANEVERLVAML